MVASNKNTLTIGVIAEEANDVDVLYEITRKLIRDCDFSFKPFLGHGCGKIRRKCKAWANNLVRRGCTHLVVMHDRDRWDVDELRTLLRDKLGEHSRDTTLVLIPVEELEAWLLSDPKAIMTAFRMRTEPKIKNDSEAIDSPKEYLKAIVQRNSKTRYLNTVHNKKIAENLRLTSLRRCKSFRPYQAFLKSTRSDGT